MAMAMTVQQIKEGCKDEGVCQIEVPGSVLFSIERAAASFGSKRKWSEVRSFCKQLQ